MDRFSRFDTIPECDSQPPSHVLIAITLNAKASSLIKPANPGPPAKMNVKTERENFHSSRETVRE